MMRARFKIGRQPGEEDTKKCVRCGKIRPIEDYAYVPNKYGFKPWRNNRCFECVNEMAMIRYRARKLGQLSSLPSKESKPKSKKTQKKPKKKITPTCKENCEFYPCFKGMDNISSNLALTCNRFRRR